METLLSETDLASTSTLLPPTKTLWVTEPAATAPPPTQTSAPSFSTPHPILGDLRVRQAIAYCTDRDELVRAIYPWLDDPGFLEIDSLVPREHWAYPKDDPDFTRYPFDPEKGKDLLEQAGWRLAEGEPYRASDTGQELSLTLSTTTSEFRKTWTAVFIEQMKACGVKIQGHYLPAEQLFGEHEDGVLQHREFELAAFARITGPENDSIWHRQFNCDQIPSPENGWQGTNYSGWCNPTAGQAIQVAQASLERETRRQAYQTVQKAYTLDLPGLPLFQRAEVYAAHPSMENFAPDPGETLFTWNAAQWAIPGKDTIVIGERSEPAGLFEWGAYVADLVRALVFGQDYTSLGHDFQPVTLKELPTIENGGATVDIVEISEGQNVVDVDGKSVELLHGVRVYDAQGNEVIFDGGKIQMRQLTTTYEFLEGLAWSDGAPVSAPDYELDYRVRCSPEIHKVVARAGWDPFPFCSQASNVEFLNDTSYAITWKPGYQDPHYFLPPIKRQPSHLVLGDGRRLADVPPLEWPDLQEVKSPPLSTGPYILKRWIYGEQMVFEANPHYFQGPPVTPNLILRFIPQDQTANAFVQGAVDVLGSDSILPEQVEALLQAQAAGQARLHFVPSNVHEAIDFALFTR